MDEEEELKRLSEESKKEQIIKYREDSTMPIELAVNLDEGYVRGGIGNQNLVINDDASAILEKQPFENSGTSLVA